MRPFYAPSYDRANGVQTAYDAGLVYFPDNSLAAEPLGDLASIIGGITGAVVGGPGGATAGYSAGGALSSVLGGGTAVDQARQARVNYVAQSAANGNVAAMQIILTAPQNVSSNEAPMWQAAAQAVRQAAPDVYQAGVEAGPLWLSNSGDTAQNYPALRNLLQTWAAQHPLDTAYGALSSSVGGLFTHGGPTAPGAPVQLAPRVGLSPVAIAGALVLGALVLWPRKRR